jgi:hypothetical protein
VIYNPLASQDAEEVVFRILLFKFFNRISTWETLVKDLGIPSWKNFGESVCVAVLDGIEAKGGKIFSGAYMHNDLKNYAHISHKKYPRYIRLLKEMMQDDVTGKLQAAQTYRDAFHVLHAYPLHENFIGMQHLTDINYSTVINFDEDDFIRPGPGALRGIQKCFAFGRKPTVSEAVECIEGCVAGQSEFFQHFGLKTVALFGRRLHSIDCQNLFCEVDKYAREAHPHFKLKDNEKIKQKFRPLESSPSPFFPPKWGLKVPTLVPFVPPRIP